MQGVAGRQPDYELRTVYSAALEGMHIIHALPKAGFRSVHIMACAMHELFAGGGQLCATASHFCPRKC